MTDYLFSGLKVLDVGTFIAGPVAGTILADFGADVIKVEPPGIGDPLRRLSFIPTTPDSESNYLWNMDARNKRSIVLDLKSEEGRAILHKLIEQCDVYITNQPFPVRESLKLNYEDIKPINPRMIYASLSAYGEKGPDKDGKGFDLVAYWAKSGLMDLMRPTDSSPTQAVPGMGDHPTAVSLYASILTALIHREKTGEGSMAHTSLIANGIWSAASIAQGGLAASDNMEGYRQRYAKPKGLAGRVYRTKDNRWLQITMLRTPEQLASLLAVLGLSEVISDERFASREARALHTVELSDLVQDALLKEDSEDWLEVFAEFDVPMNRVSTVEEAIGNEQFKVNDVIVSPADTESDSHLILNHPVKVTGVEQVGPKRAPDHGEHSEQILLGLGYSDEDIRMLREKGII